MKVVEAVTSATRPVALALALVVFSTAVQAQQPSVGSHSDC